MVTVAYTRRLVDEIGLRRIAQALVLVIFAAPSVVWIVADFYVIARGAGDDTPLATLLFKFLTAPFSTDFASLGFVATVVIPAALGVVCYQFKPRQGDAPSATIDQLNLTGYIVVALCIAGVAVGFVTMVIITSNTPSVDALSGTGHTTIHALATATFTFYSLYLIQFLGFSPK